MSKFTNSLNDIKVASPCSQDWEAMIGTERKRYCGECRLNVYNLSGMTRVEAENLIADAEGRLCVRFFKRADGTVLTKDCPVGWKAFKKRLSVGATAFASLLFSLVGGLGLTAMFSQSNKGAVVVGELITYNPTPKPTPKQDDYPLMGAVEISAPTPKPTPKPKSTPKDDMVMGKISVRQN